MIFNWRKEKIFQKMFIPWKLINGLKKIEKEIFPVGKIKGKESFPTAKEKVYSPVILNQHAIYLEKKKRFSAAKETVDSPVILNQCGI